MSDPINLPRFGQPGYREALLDALDTQKLQWDVIVIGGGITGAGILRECARYGLSALLIEKHDFAWGTSSKSSKMVHGGLRYLATGQLGLTRDSVRERQRLLTEAPGLVEPLNFLMPHYEGDFPPGYLFNRVLDVYDLMAGHRNHRRFQARDAIYLAPGLREQGLRSLTQFGDAVTDDARLVLRVLHEATSGGRCHALNYLTVEHLLETQGEVKGVALRDRENARTLEQHARVVINATGAWTDKLRQQQGGEKHIRPLRGSHLVLPANRFPVGYAVSFFHPADKRPVFVFPWEGTTVIGTTDLDHDQDMERDARITVTEYGYLMDAVDFAFPGLKLNRDDVLCTWSGIRPVVGTGAINPSKEKREHSIWMDRGLISVAGGKLTTFRLIARDVLQAAKPVLGELSAPRRVSEEIFSPCPQLVKLPGNLTRPQRQRICGRYGRRASEILLNDDDARRVSDSATLLGEVRWSLEHEQVRHLDDLLLRRTRLGLLLADGAQGLLADLKPLCLSRLGWDEARWSEETARYRKLFLREYGVPV